MHSPIGDCVGGEHKKKTFKIAGATTLSWQEDLALVLCLVIVAEQQPTVCMPLNSIDSEI